MSEDQQLTVAELLARAQKDNPEAGKRRRRRRSLEDGGVSVAELTGSLKRVDARPQESKHSSVPIDPPEEQAPAKEKNKSAAADSAASTPRKVEVEKVEVKRPAQSKDAPAPSAGDTAVLRKVESGGVSRPVKVKPEAPAKPTEDAEATGKIPVVEEAPKKSAAADSADSADLADRKKSAAADSTVPAEVEDGDDSINPIMLVLLVFCGLILGVLGFLAFQWIWAHAATAVAIIAGIVAVVAVIFGVKALRTGNDALTVSMAAIAAAVMAFGPALI
ncbi:hypothetical protein [Corynebacterium sp. p3-SID1056]|uniref:hypothetical protein n=1 Tax=Corynebacterium sp. p3-SID1056 TaxID=2916092 RepID=UPI0021A6CFAD|nr:hypothetical protein [Corynebacterium sp. p3-SID1056]MCT2339328.1 hypothetical protein [Corynebacterium sp. p3-SID1056]